MTENTINIDGMTKEKPHNEIIYLINLLSLCLLSARANGTASKQLMKADKKAW